MGVAMEKEFDLGYHVKNNTALLQIGKMHLFLKIYKSHIKI